MKITLSSFTLTPAVGWGSAPKVRLWTESQFQASTGELHLVGNETENYEEITLSASGDGFTFPTGEFDTTTDSSDPNALYSAAVFNGTRNVYMLFERWAFPASLGATVSWADLEAYNVDRVPLRDDTAYSKVQTDARIASALAVTNPATVSALGRLTVSVAPADAASPIAVGTNDPRVPTQGENDALAGTAGTPSTSNRYVTDADTRLIGLPSEGIFDANDYGAVAYDDYASAAAGTDSAEAFTNCIAAAVAWAQLNTGFCKVVYDPGVYAFKRAPVTTNNAYAQVPLPLVTLGAARVYLLMEPKTGGGNTIAFQGTGEGVAAAFYSTRTGDIWEGAAGWPAMIGGPDDVHGVAVNSWSWMTFHIKRTAFHQAANPSLACLQLKLLVRAVVEDCRFDVEGVTGFPAEFTEPTNPTGVVCLLPMGGTDGMSYVGLIDAMGYYGGPGISELTEVSGQLYVYQCRVGLNFQDTGNYHSPIISHAIAVRCPYVLAKVHPTLGVVGPDATTLPYTYHCKLNIQHLDIEEGFTSSAWHRHVCHVYDPNIALNGYIGYQRVLGGAGDTIGPLTMVGGGYLETRDLGSPPPQRVAWQDTFTHTFAQENSALSGRTPEKTAGGGNWAVLGAFADFKLVNNRLKADTAGNHRVRAGAGAGNYNGTFEYVANVVSGGIVGGIVRRVDDSNYVYVRALHTGALLKLHEVVAGVDTEQSSVSFADIVAGKDLLYQVILDGNRVRVRADGGELIDWTLSAGAIAAGLNAGTGVGLLVSSGQNSTIGAARFLR